MALIQINPKKLGGEKNLLDSPTFFQYPDVKLYIIIAKDREQKLLV
jgi:hypothetical protein